MRKQVGENTCNTLTFRQSKGLQHLSFLLYSHIIWIIFSDDFFNGCCYQCKQQGTTWNIVGPTLLAIIRKGKLALRYTVVDLRGHHVACPSYGPKLFLENVAKSYVGAPSYGECWIRPWYRHWIVFFGDRIALLCHTVREMSNNCATTKITRTAFQADTLTYIYALL